MNSGRPRLERRNKFLQSVGARRSGSASPIDPTLPRNSDDSRADLFLLGHGRPWQIFADYAQVNHLVRALNTRERERETRNSSAAVCTSNFLSLARFPLSWLFRVVKYHLMRIINSTVCGLRAKRKRLFESRGSSL